MVSVPPTDAIYAHARRSRTGFGDILPHLLLICMGLMLWVLFALDASSMSLVFLSNLASLYTLAAVIMVGRVSPQGFWSASPLYLIILSLFHFGLTTVYGLGLPIGGTTQTNLAVWFYTPFTKEAVVLSSIGLVSAGMGCVIAFLWGARPSEPIVVPPRGRLSARERHLDQALSIAGSMLVGVSICGWLLILIQSGGVGVLFSSYETMLQVVGESTFLTFTYYGINIGTTLLAAAQPSALRRAGFVAFSLWGILALGLGLRSEVLFPAVTALVIIAKRKPLFSARVALVLGIALLGGIAAIREVRQVGIQNAASATVTASPLDGLTELGSSLRPVTETIYWRSTGDPFIYGASFWEPLGRQLVNFLPQLDWKRPPAEQDPLILSSLAAMRTGGQIGYSPIAEGYRNFGTVGVMLFMGLTGWIIGRMDRWPATPVRQALLGVIFVPILVEVRNSFTPVPLEIVVGCCVLGLTVFISRSISRILL